MTENGDRCNLKRSKTKSFSQGWGFWWIFRITLILITFLFCAKTMNLPRACFQSQSATRLPFFKQGIADWITHPFSFVSKDYQTFKDSGTLLSSQSLSWPNNKFCNVKIRMNDPLAAALNEISEALKSHQNDCFVAGLIVWYLLPFFGEKNMKKSEAFVENFTFHASLSLVMTKLNQFKKWRKEFLISFYLYYFNIIYSEFSVGGCNEIRLIKQFNFFFLNPWKGFKLS